MKPKPREVARLLRRAVELLDAPESTAPFVLAEATRQTAKSWKQRFADLAACYSAVQATLGINGHQMYLWGLSVTRTEARAVMERLPPD